MSMSHIFEGTSSHFLRNDITQLVQEYFRVVSLLSASRNYFYPRVHWEPSGNIGFKWFPASLIFQDVVLFAARLSPLIHKQLNTHFLMHVRSR